MSGSKWFIVPAGVRLREETQDHVLVYFEENGYETNAVGAWLIERVRTSKQTISSLCESVCKEFDAPPEQVKPDVEAIAAEFVRIGIFQETES